jgi:hypothetical protein
MNRARSTAARQVAKPRPIVVRAEITNIRITP